MLQVGVASGHGTEPRLIICPAHSGASGMMVEESSEGWETAVGGLLRI